MKEVRMVADQTSVSRRETPGDPRKIRVLMYHRILREEMTPPSHRYWLLTKDFRRHLKYLTQFGYTSITFEDYWLHKHGQKPLPRKPVVITFDDGYLDTYTEAFPIVREFGMKAVVFAVADPDVRESFWDKDKPNSVVPLMTAEQLLELRNAGWEIGSHSLHHRNLSQLSPEEAWDEISRSKSILEYALHSPVRSFCYPYGSINQTVKKMVQDAGYTVAVAAWAGPPVFGKDDFLIRRIAVIKKHHFLVMQYAIKLMSIYLYSRWAWWRIRTFLYSMHIGTAHDLEIIR
jgi:peptidoglycan/xylan/chitin deacetylase (PgdA/CDA1 family)